MIEQNQTSADEIDQEEVTSASNVIRSLTKAIKAYKIYLPNNPLHRKFFDQLKESMDDHLAEFGDLDLIIEQFIIKLEGATIYENEEAKESLAFKLNSDGIISLTFSEGLHEDEISAFLEIIGKERPYETDDDIVTQLWTENLSHISYIVADDTDAEVDGTGIGNGREASKEQQKDIKSEYSDMSTEPPPPSPMKIPQSILSLSADEIAWLKRIKDFEETRKPVDDVINIITAILSSPLELSLFNDFMEVTTDLTIDLIKSGEVACSLELIYFISGLEKNEHMTADHRELIKLTKSKLFSKDMIVALEKIVDSTDKIEPRQLKTLILMFGRDAVRPIINLLGETSKKDMRKAIIEGLVEIGRNIPEEFFPCLKDDRWYLVRNAVLILRLIENPIAVKEVRRLISHSDLRVRKEVLLYLQSVSDESSMEAITKFLGDENDSIKKRALKLLVEQRHKPAFKTISMTIKSEDFEERELAEKKLFLEAFAELGQEEAIPTLKEMLTTKYWLNKPREKEITGLAIAGLRKINPATAIQLLSEAKASKKGEIADLIELAIKAISGKNQ